ncbi:ROK family protein [Tautonia marina]|uniref:ROK family protein n=1 Tax=Tautonia marina TaxID=2653855 RepID=UPI001260BA99|nr:ROK family protein [Tautonia marina]
MSATRSVYIGTDSGATTSKVGAVWEDGSLVSTKLLQQPTDSHVGPEAVVRGWVEAIGRFLEQHGLVWDQVQGVGLAIPGPFRSDGVLDRSANLDESFVGFDIRSAYMAALFARTGRPIPVVVGNDGDLGGVGEAQRVRGSGTGSVVMLAAGSGLGAAYVDGRGLPLNGDSLAGMEAGHMPAPLQMLGVPAYPCGCGRDWGCVEVYTTLSGLPHLLGAKLPEYPDHELAKSDRPMKERVFALRELAQQGDELALSLFDFQARAMGFHVANLTIALDPSFFVIGGGLMDPEATTTEFRERYLGIVRKTAEPYLFPRQRERMKIVPATLGDLSQSIGAALVALYQGRA